VGFGEAVEIAQESDGCNGALNFFFRPHK
jgi:hypothetical protein